MKKVILLSFISIISTTVFSQITTYSDAELGLGVEVATPLSYLKSTNGTGYGGSAKFAYNFDHITAATFQAGYLSFPGNTTNSSDPTGRTTFITKSPTLGFIPVKVGIRLHFFSGFYVEPQAGAAYVLSEAQTGETSGNAGFDFALNTGFHTLPGLDIGIHYESVSLDQRVAYAGLRVAYTFTFRHQAIY